MPGRPSVVGRWLRLLQPSHEHSAFSATVLVMAAVMLSRVIGYLREAYIAYAFGAGPNTDAYVAAFTLPDWLNYIVAGGTASITFVSIFTRYTSQGRREEGERAYSIIITVMSTVLVAGIVIAEIFAPQIVRFLFPKFSLDQQVLCAFLTRILLPAQLFFYVGGVVSAVLLSQRLFLFPALGPLLYNVFIILGGVLGGRQAGVASLAFGALAGSFAGPFLINAIGTARAGVRYRPSFDVRHPAFREWVSLSIPLMLGVSLVSADEWILRLFAAGVEGDITRLNYAKRLFQVPIAVLGQATGQASLPFFARLFGEGRRELFARTVNDSVYRVSAVSLLVSGWMMAVSLPIIDLVYRRGKFTFSDSRETAVFFFWFALSLAFWSAQAQYSRAFYAAGNTLTPMLASTIVTVASIPVYSVLFRQLSVPGLAIASDIGIAANTVVTAWLLHQKRLVLLQDMNWREMGRALITALFAGFAAYGVSRLEPLGGGRWNEVYSICLVSLTWAAAVAAGLWLTRSRLLLELRNPQSAVRNSQSVVQ